MLRKLSLLVPAALASVSSLGLAETVYTDPTGYVKLGNTTGGATPAVPANTDVFLGVPLEQKVEFSGVVLSATANSITFSGTPGWSANQWAPATGTPFCAVVSSGAQNGIRGLISANTANSLTLTVTTPGTLASVFPGDKVQIRKCWTLKTFFADSTLSPGCRVYLYDNQAGGINHSVSAIYTFAGADWYSSSGVSNNVILHPGELVLLRSSSTPIAKLTVYGDVPVSTGRVDISKNVPGTLEDMEIAHGYPVPKFIGDLGLPVENGDRVYLYNNKLLDVNKSAAEILTYGAGNWYSNKSGGTPVNFSVSLPPGQGFLLRRAAGSASSAEWVMPAP